MTPTAIEHIIIVEIKRLLSEGRVVAVEVD